MRIVPVILLVLVLTACVTETVGGLPPPAQNATRVTAQLDLARGYFASEDWSRARTPLNRALQIDPKSAEAHVLLAVLSDREGEPEVAENHLKQALKIDSDNPQALNNYGGFLYRQQRFDEALPPLRKLVRDTEYHARSQAYENLGLAELRAGNAGLANEAFSRALALNFAQVRSSLELADMAYADGDYDAARDYYEGFRSRARQNPRSLCLGMKLGQAFGDSDQLASYALALQNLFPNSPEASQCEVPR